MLSGGACGRMRAAGLQIAIEDDLPFSIFEFQALGLRFFLDTRNAALL
jgi:hypothetical protein